MNSSINKQIWSEVDNYNSSLVVDPVLTLAKCSQKAARQLISEELALKLQVLPLVLTTDFATGNECLYCSADVKLKRELVPQIRFLTEKEVKIVPAKQWVLQEAIPLAYAISGDRLLAAADKLNQATGLLEINNNHYLLELPPAVGEPSRMVKELIEFAKAHQASDLHLEPRQEGVFLSLRTSAQLMSRKTPLYSLGFHRLIVNRVKTLAGMDISKKSSPQDGAIRASAEIEQDIRVSTLPCVWGESLTLRFVSTAYNLSISQLGLPHEVQQYFVNDLVNKTGLFIVAGATGSGKTTTLYALMQQLVSQNQRVLSVEDPVERQIASVIQTTVKPTQGVGFEEALRAALRQDPDVLVIGEIRDSITAQIAAQAAQTGHLVLTSIHAGSIEQVKVRLAQLGVSNFEMDSAILGILVQELESVAVNEYQFNTRLKIQVYFPTGS